MVHASNWAQVLRLMLMPSSGAVDMPKLHTNSDPRQASEVPVDQAQALSTLLDIPPSLVHLVDVKSEIVAHLSLHGTAHLPVRRLVLMGGKRVGKSSSGNTILGSNVFDSERGFEKCVQKQAEVLGRSIKVTDTPGWDELNAGDTPQRIRDEILDSVSQCDPGPHVFLLVVPVQDFLEEHRRAAEDMLTTLSPSVWRHTIVLLTWAAKFAPNSLEEFLEVQPHLKALVTKCGGRVHAVDNKNCTNEAQTAELLTKVDALIEANCGLYFSLDVNYMYSMLEDAKKELERFEREAEEMKGALMDKSKELENLQHLHEDELAERDENFQAKLKEKDQSLEQLQSDIEQMLKEKESEMEALKAQQETLMTAMQSKVEDLEQGCLNLSEELATGQVQIEKLEEKLKEYEKTLDDKEKYLAEMRICQDNDAKHKTNLEDQIRNAEASLVESSVRGERES
ncbi:GTPase IMAP family member 7-like [Hoplias malabaricus]|uniref:GTPase IMAP family member 7-like n=1 Tax=Hoplias malabaricus TaxID=27720 RepID=UPI003462617B